MPRLFKLLRRADVVKVDGSRANCDFLADGSAARLYPAAFGGVRFVSDQDVDFNPVDNQPAHRIQSDKGPT